MKELIEMQADTVAGMLIDLNAAIKKKLSEEPAKSLSSDQKADAVFRTTTHLLGQQIAMGIVMSPEGEVNLNAVCSAVATKIKAAAETYIKIMRKEKDAKANDQRH